MLIIAVPPVSHGGSKGSFADDNFDVILYDLVYENWGRVDSNHRNPKVRDLQSLAIGRYATPP